MAIYNPADDDRLDSPINEVLVDRVIEQIRRDLDSEDVTAIYELLAYLPAKVLEAYLPEVMIDE